MSSQHSSTHIHLSGYTCNDVITTHQGTSVYRAIRAGTNESFIIKLMMNQSSSADQLIRLNHEFSILNELNTAYTPKAVELIRFDGGVALVQQDMGPENQQEMLEKAEPLDLARRLELAIEIIRAIGIVHSQHIIHKDINPTNIVWNAENDQVALVDFGISSRHSHQQYDFSSPKSIEGTLNYIAPEQTGRMNREVDYRSDYYSFGVVLYELFSGQTPFSCDDPLALIHAHLAIPPEKIENINPDIPQSLSRIIHTLLAKSAKDRYQSSYGIRKDLEHCLEIVQGVGESKDFVIGQFDHTKTLQQPQRLYGRKRQQMKIVQSFKNIAAGGCKSFFIGGLPGIGKSALVKETHAEITRFGGYYCSGKFDQLQRTLPYSALVQACSHLVNQTLLSSSDQFDTWKEKILKALGHNTQVMVDFLPELKVLGQQEAVQELGPVESQNRFKRVVTNFLKVFCSKASPVMLFIDDLQWADLATLKLLEHLLINSDIEHLLLVGCFRSNEVDQAHPFRHFLDILKDHDSLVEHTEIGPLEEGDITQLVEDVLPDLSCPSDTFAAVLKDKTSGNPFFLNLFLQTLNSDGLLVFNEDHDRWEVDLEAVDDIIITENVVEYMLEQLHKFPVECQKVLATGSCIGKTFNIDQIACIIDIDIATAHKVLASAIEARLISPELTTLTVVQNDNGSTDTIYNSFTFKHDRIQQAARLLPGIDPHQVHYQIAQIMLEDLTDDPAPEYLFDLVDHLNAAEIGNVENTEGMQLISLNLKAADVAKQATAYDSALVYLQHCDKHFPKSQWDNHPQYAYRMCLGMAEIYYLVNEREKTAPWMDAALKLAQSKLDIAAVHNLAVTYLAMNGKYHESFDRAVETLRMFGIVIDVDNLEQAIGKTFEQIESRINDVQGVADIYNLQDITDPEMKCAMKILAEITSVSFAISPYLFTLTNATTVLWALKHGLCADSAPSFGCLGLLYNALFDRPQIGYAYGKLCKRLGERYEDLAQRSKTIDWFCNFNVVWNHPLKDTVPLNREALALALDTGDLPFAGFIVNHIAYNAFYMGIPLDKLESDCREHLNFLDRISHLYAYDCVQGAEWVISHYRSPTETPLTIPADKQEFLERCKAPETFFPLSRYLVLLTQLYVIENNIEDGWRCAKDAESHVPDMPGTISVANQLFYYLLAGINYFDTLSSSEQKSHLEMLREKARTLFDWGERTPENFGHMAELVQAEFSRLDGRFEQALAHYDEAITLARENGLVHDEALACERAALFWKRQNRERLATPYILEAYHAYHQWGCLRRCSYLVRMYPALISSGQTHITAIRTLTTNYDSLNIDLVQLLKSIHAISETAGLDQLLNRIMKVLLENAGASRGCLFLMREGELHLEALAEADKPDIEIFIKEPIPFPQAGKKWNIPLPFVSYVAKRQESLIIDTRGDFCEYLNEDVTRYHLPNSAICIPSLKQNKLYGVVYLENSELEGAFTSDRVQILKAISGQMTISIENSILYEDLENRVRIRTEELEKSNEQLKHLSMRDPLTNCYNRRAFYEYFENELAEAQRHDFQIGCIMIDADHFKSINDTHGHTVGDEVLQAIAETLLTRSRVSDCVCRYGGEEFCILLTHSNLDQTCAVAEFYRQTLEQLHPANLPVTVSIGVSALELGATDVSEMLQQADDALYVAKRGGRNRVVRWDKHLHLK